METQVHGALVSVSGVGVLIRGPSGIGKSETALELVTRGHRLVADDVVRVRREADGPLWGTAPELIRHHIEIRVNGILYVPDIYGEDAVCAESPIELGCRLEHWRDGEDYDRLGLSRPTEKLLDVEVPCVLLPVRPGRNLATLVEVAARDHRQRSTGLVAASRLDARIRDEARRP